MRWTMKMAVWPHHKSENSSQSEEMKVMKQEPGQAEPKVRACVKTRRSVLRALTPSADLREHMVHIHSCMQRKYTHVIKIIFYKRK